MLRCLALAVLLPLSVASAQEATRDSSQQALQKKFSWAVEATRNFIAKAEGWPESDFAIILKADNPDHPGMIVARVVRRDSPFFVLEECPISPPICWNELHFVVKTKDIAYIVWGNQ